ncbi:hypothetical protein ACFVT5_13415 [Streptomyces sp. NPDC058001]|uniref:hypothetical protein n=1 Tax=Streptomyces sp. NPDC058001 TaxID=3346300 RepID=UPI0036F0B866
MSDGRVRIELRLTDTELPCEHWDAATESLRQGLFAYGAELIRPSSAQAQAQEQAEATAEATAEAEGQAAATAPLGAKGDPLTMSLIAALIASPVLTEVVRLAAGWVGRTQHRSVELTGPAGSIKVTGHPKGEEEALVAAWLRENTTPTTADATSTPPARDGAGTGGDTEGNTNGDRDALAGS